MYYVMPAWLSDAVYIKADGRVDPRVTVCFGGSYISTYDLGNIPCTPCSFLPKYLYQSVEYGKQSIHATYQSAFTSCVAVNSSCRRRISSLGLWELMSYRARTEIGKVLVLVDGAGASCCCEALCCWVEEDPPNLERKTSAANFDWPRATWIMSSEKTPWRWEE